MKDQNGLGAWQLTILALGTVVGGSFFLGSSIAIKAAGPAIFAAYILGGFLVYIVLTALSEMTVAQPAAGSFRSYAEKNLSPIIGFVVGWLYWTGLVLAMSSEATAASIFINTWFPQLSTPFLSVSIVIAVTLLNLLGARTLSHLESGLAGIKLAALVGFAVIAILLITGVFPGKPVLGLGALSGEPLLPSGIAGLAGSMLIVLFTYAGFEVIGLASSEARDPHRTVPRAIMYTVVTLVGLYTLVIAVLLPLVSTASLTAEVSPLVAALTAQGLGVAAGTINVILVTAIISTMLAATFGLGRMMRSLASAGHAPRFLIDQTDIPYRGILFSGLAMLAGVSMGYLLPGRIYLFLVSSGGFALLFTYLVILFAHHRFRRNFGCPPQGHCQLAGYPYTSWLAMISLVVIIITMPLIPGQGSGLLAGLLFTALYFFAYMLLQPGQKPVIIHPADYPAHKPLSPDKHRNEAESNDPSNKEE